MTSGAKKKKVKEPKVTSIGISIPLWNRFKSQAAARGMKAREAVEEALVLWLSSLKS